MGFVLIEIKGKITEEDDGLPAAENYTPTKNSKVLHFYRKY
jgi:hypothetical protein